jgi:hypothetical protein
LASKKEGQLAIDSEVTICKMLQHCWQQAVAGIAGNLRVTIDLCAVIYLTGGNYPFDRYCYYCNRLYNPALDQPHMLQNQSCK